MTSFNDDEKEENNVVKDKGAVNGKEEDVIYINGSDEALQLNEIGHVPII